MPCPAHCHGRSQVSLTTLFRFTPENPSPLCFLGFSLVSLVGSMFKIFPDSKFLFPREFKPPLPVARIIAKASLPVSFLPLGPSHRRQHEPFNCKPAYATPLLRVPADVPLHSAPKLRSCNGPQSLVPHFLPL